MRFTVLGGNAPLLLKRQNRAAVLRAIVTYGPIARRTLRDTTGLTASTITNVVALPDGVTLNRLPLSIWPRPCTLLTRTGGSESDG
jgi:hypothetical protein